MNILIVPVFVHNEVDAREVINAITSLSNLGKIYLVNQGIQIKCPPGTITIYHKKHLGNWGAVKIAYDRIMLDGLRKQIERIVLILSFKYFGPDIVTEIIEAQRATGIPHVIGARQDIAGSLAGKKDPNIGLARAQLECFFTSLAGIVFLDHPCFSQDGFSGLHVFSPAHFASWDWKWVKQTTWGGALVVQLHSVEHRYNRLYYPVPHTSPRNWDSDLGTNIEIVVQSMLKQVLQLSVFQNVSRDQVSRAIEAFPYCFKSQPGISIKSAGYIREMIWRSQFFPTAN